MTQPWLWYYSSSEDGEVCFGEHQTREDAVAAGRAEYGSAAFWVLEAQKGEPTIYQLFTDADESGWAGDPPSADAIIEMFGERNGEHWGEDGFYLDGDSLQERLDALVRPVSAEAVNDLVSAWCAQNAEEIQEQVWVFDSARSHEKIEGDDGEGEAA